MNKKLVITNCGMCPAFAHKEGFARVAYVPKCRTMQHDLPFIPQAINGGYVTAVATKEIPKWCPLEDDA